MGRILIIEDEAAICWALGRSLGEEGHDVAVASSGEEGLEKVGVVGGGGVPDVVILDVRLPGIDGLAVLSRLRESCPGLPVIVMTAHGTVQTAIDAMRRGAYEYLLKPVNIEEAKLLVQRALEARRASREVAELRRRVAGDPDLSGLVGTSPQMQEIYKKIGILAAADATVLVSGETGTGKELAARAIHFNSDRRDGPFIPINCAALPEPLLESELYGHVKGAFTGALRDKIGKVETAHKGTLFLDEVAELPRPLQGKLLRFLEEKMFERVGSVEPVEVDVRIIAATNRNLYEAVRKGAFRDDLYYRLNVLSVELPPLRERRRDIEPLAEHFLAVSGGGALGEEARGILKLYSWPGNVRELKNAMEHARILARGGTIGPGHLPEDIVSPRQPSERAVTLQEAVAQMLESRAASVAEDSRLYEEIMAELEKPIIAKALDLTDGNQLRAAKLLGIHRTTLHKKMEQYGL